MFHRQTRNFVVKLLYWIELAACEIGTVHQMDVCIAAEAQFITRWKIFSIHESLFIALSYLKY